MEGIWDLPSENVVEKEQDRLFWTNLEEIFCLKHSAFS